MRDKEMPMKKIAIIPGVLLAAGLTALTAADVPTYVGAGKCRDCHMTEKQGKQYPIWAGGKHAQAFNYLKAESAKNEAGESIPAQRSPVCLRCHAPLSEKAPEVSVEGVSCEVCHGAGSRYRKFNVMVNREACVKNGLVIYASLDAVKAACLTCHADAHGLAFDFPAAWEAVKHYKPGK
jgi:hypothetical protein